MNLYPREQHSEDLRAVAHRLLDDAKAGFYVSLDDINWALRVTGDLEA